MYIFKTLKADLYIFLHQIDTVMNPVCEASAFHDVHHQPQEGAQ